MTFKRHFAANLYHIPFHYPSKQVLGKMICSSRKKTMGGWLHISFAIWWLAFTPAFASSSLSEGLGVEHPSETTRDQIAMITKGHRSVESKSIVPRKLGLSERAREFLSLLSTIEAEGLEPEHYYKEEMVALSAKSDISEAEFWSIERSVGSAYLKLGKDLAQGQTDWTDFNPRWYIPRNVMQQDQLDAVLASEHRMSDAVVRLSPAHESYRGLKNALLKYKKIARTGGWEIVEGRRKLELGTESPMVEKLRQRLAKVGDLDSSGAANPNLFNERLEAAVKRFQSRHGLTADGIVGRKTRKALNVSAEERLNQIRINMERWRWMPRELGDRYIFVNTAAFKLEYIEDDEVQLKMRVIVGDLDNRTPVFTKQLTYVDINPVWNVPQKIVTEEILPKLAMKPDYLETNRFRILSDWTRNAQQLSLEETGWTSESNEEFSYRLQQESGERNALGRIKFMLPNHFNIYLHDTPGKSLFKKARRTFSHGCIRLENPRELALALFEQLDRWDKRRLDEALESKSNVQAVLKTPVPVYITYFTSWVDEEGMLYFSGDHYGRDRVLAAQLFPGKAITY